MSLTVFKSNGLNDQDFEHGTLQKRPPLSFIPRVEKEIEGFVPPTRKITFLELVEEKVVIFTGTTPEAYMQLQDTYEGLLRKKGYRKQYDKSEVVLKKAENRLDIHIETRLSQSDETNLTSESESEDEFDQKLAKARQAGTTDIRKKKKADKQDRKSTRLNSSHRT